MQKSCLKLLFLGISSDVRSTAKLNDLKEKYEIAISRIIKKCFVLQATMFDVIHGIGGR